MTTRQGSRRLIGCLLTLIGVCVAASALLSPVKAWLGHTLLERELAQRMAAAPDDRANADDWHPWPWASIAPVGEVGFPALGETRVVVDSASGEALAWAVGHLEATAGLGDPGVTALAGHRDGRFQILGQVGIGDVVQLTGLDGATIDYRVHDRVIVDAEDVTLATIHDGPDELVLITCWPIDALWSGSQRLVVRAERSPTPVGGLAESGFGAGP